MSSTAEAGRGAHPKVDWKRQLLGPTWAERRQTDMEIVRAIKALDVQGVVTRLKFAWAEAALLLTVACGETAVVGQNQSPETESPGSQTVEAVPIDISVGEFTTGTRVEFDSFYDAFLGVNVNVPYVSNIQPVTGDPTYNAIRAVRIDAADLSVDAFMGHKSNGEVHTTLVRWLQDAKTGEMVGYEMEIITGPEGKKLVDPVTDDQGNWTIIGRGKIQNGRWVKQTISLPGARRPFAVEEIGNFLLGLDLGLQEAAAAKSTATLPPTATSEPTPEPAEIKYLLDVDHRELFEPVECEGEWEKCDQVINGKLVPYLDTFSIPPNSDSYETTTGRATVVTNPGYVGYFKLRFQGQDQQIDGYVFVFEAKVKGKEILLPLMPIGSGFGDVGVYNITDPEALSRPGNLSGWWKSPRELISILSSTQDGDLLQIYIPHDISQSPIDKSPKGKFVTLSATDPYGREDGITSVGLVESFFIKNVQWP